MPADPAKARLPWAWIGFFGVIVLLAVIAAGALLSTGRQLARQEVPAVPLWQIIIDGQVQQISDANLSELAGEIQDIVARREAVASDELTRLIDEEVERVFEPVYAGIPRFADWYYSLTGEYLRYAHAIGGDVSDYLQRQLKERVFDAAALEQALAELPERLDQQTLTLLSETHREMLAAFKSALADRIEGPAQANATLVGRVDIDQQLTASLEPTLADIRRQVISLTAATGAGVVIAKGGAALVIKKTLASIAATKSFQVAGAVLAKLAAKSALKGGGVLASAGAAAAVCSPTGPGALICGAVAGLAAWVAVDLAVMEVDEALNRDLFEADMAAAIREQQHQLKEQLQKSYTQLLSKRLLQLGNSVSGRQTLPDSYRPADLLLQP